MQLIQGRLIAEIVSFHMSDWDRQQFPQRTGIGKRNLGILNSHLHRFADVFQAGVAHKRSRQKAGLAQDLKAIADSQYQSPTLGKPAHRLHYWRKFRNRAGSQVIPKSEPSRNNDRIAILQIVRFMPQESNWLFGYLLQGPEGVVITVRTGKDDDSKFHRMS